jgi:hypothetical protein
MMTEARWPNGDDLFHVNWAVAQSGTDVAHIMNSKLPAINWTGAKIHLWSGVDPFAHETGVVTSSGEGQISIGSVETATCPDICPRPGGYFYLFGILGALDVEGEWYYDANSQTLYFMAPGKANPNNIDVRSKQRQYAFDLRGKSGVTIQDISIFSCSILTDSKSTNNTLDRIDAQYVSHFTTLPTAPNDPDGNLYSILQVHTKDSGIVMDGTGNILQNSTISYSAGAGVALEGSNNTVRNNLIKNIDYIGDYASGIDLDGNNNIVQNNTITTIGRQAIIVNAVTNEDISYNNLFDTMMLSRDGGAIYACCNQIASGTRIHHNWIHDTSETVGGSGDAYPLSGLTFDNGSSGFVADQNVLWGNQLYNINIAGFGSSAPNTNYIHNNTIPDSSSDGAIVLQAVSDCSATRIVDNRVVLGVLSEFNESACVVSNNNSLAPGATEMTLSTEVGCNFEGCSSNPPPGIVGADSVTQCPVTAASQ